MTDTETTALRPRKPANEPPAEAFAPIETAATGGTNFLLSAVRRWPWVLVGLLFGVVAGVFGLYLSRPNVFQSNAQVLVIKKRADAFGGSDARMMVLEDYVATQVSVIKSERIMATAAKKVPAERVAGYYPADPNNPEREVELRTKFLQGGFTVAREKDINSPAGGTNILNLNFKASSAEDAKVFLETVIATYSKELATVYDDETRKQIETADNQIRALEGEIGTLETKRAENLAAVIKITPEELAVVRVRVSKLIDQLRQLRQDESNLTSKLDLIKQVGNDPRARGLLLAQLGDVGRGGAVPVGRVDVENPDAAIRSIRLERAEQLKKYGPDHQIIQALDAKLTYLEELNKPPVGGGPAPLDSLGIAEQILKSRLANTRKDLVATDLDLDRDTKTLTSAGSLQSTIDFSTRMIQDKSLRREELKSKRQQLESTKSAGGFEAVVLSKPEADVVPVAPSLPRSIMLGAAAGLILGLGLAALAELADKSFRSPAEIRSRLGLPVIGHIPPIRTGLPMDVPLDVESSLVCAVRPKSVEAEAYRGVRTSLYFSLQGRGHQVIQVTSPNPGDGKSTLATNLAVSIAQSGKRVLLIDCDFRRPRLHKIFKMENAGPGFVAVIIGESSLRDAVRPGPVENLSLLPCGTRPTNPAELLTSPEFAKIIEQAKRDYDFVVLDTPPILAVSDPSVVAPRADGVILVFRMTSKARPQAERAREQLGSLGANVLGVVVNGAGRASDGYGYGTGAGYHYDYEYEYADKYHDDDDEANK